MAFLLAAPVAGDRVVLLPVDSAGRAGLPPVDRVDHRPAVLLLADQAGRPLVDSADQAAPVAVGQADRPPAAPVAGAIGR